MSLLEHTLANFKDCYDLVHSSMPEIQVDLIYFEHLIGADEFSRDVLLPLTDAPNHDVEPILKRSHYKKVTDAKDLVKGILNGDVAIFFKQHAYLISVQSLEARTVKQSETETVIIGPHDSFVETATVNLALIRSRIKSSHLKVIKLEVGEISKSIVYVLYIDRIANMEYVNELVERITKIEVDAVYDSHMLIQYLDDQPHSIFPLFTATERTDTIASNLAAGKVVGILEGSPNVFSAPATFFDFFTSPDDHYAKWLVGSATRLLRLIALLATLFFTALYVSITTYHYEMIPEAMLLTITSSRSKVPFPPIYEAMLMEVTIELLREAGARLPNKIGQTIGIVGGIVIGQAAVQAGLTSNILIIAVASSAIASFVIPSYVMSSSIRLVRFGIILLAGFLGNLGIVIGLALLIIHLVGLTSLKSSYLTPIAPINSNDMLDVFVRAPFHWLRKRPSQAKTDNVIKNKMKQ